MEIINFPSPMIKVHRGNIGCEFCPRMFDTIAGKNAHVLEHFEQEICTECDQNLLRIGENLYVLHGTITCINIKQETIPDEQNGVHFSSLLDGKVYADFQTELEYHGENDEYFEGKREFTEVINPIENMELSPTDDFESKLNTLPEGKSGHTESPDIILDEIKLEMNEDSELECEPTTKKQPRNVDKQYKCKIEGCGMLVASKNRSMHLARKHSGNSFECDFCKKSFPSMGQLRQHLTTHNGGEKFSCDKCGSENLTRGSLQRHHIKPSLVCSECGQAFCKMCQLREHYRNHPGANPYDGIDTKSKRTIGELYAQKNEKRFKCTVKGCDELLSTAYRKLHMAIKHEIKQFECDICEKTFPTLNQIRHHMNVHGARCKRYTCNVCGATNITLLTLQRHHYKQRIECPLCDKRFCQKIGLKKHHIDDHCGGKSPVKIWRSNKNIKRYKCPIKGCDELISTNNRGYHLASKHKTTQFECDICKKKFATKAMIRVHILRVHDPSSKKYKCDLCGSAHLTKGSLEWHHKLVHIKERNFMCSECGKTFVQKGHFIIHLTKHTGEKPYACTFEGCSKRFRTQSGRWEHSRSHTGERPYRCDVEGCDRRFAYPVDVKRHRFNAHGIYFKKYPCQICSEIFPENMLLKKHMKKHENQV